tara:strand:+ start:629 stop:751 length:123 start_codon:yes stop_codon:yes gene_type:complete
MPEHKDDVDEVDCDMGGSECFIEVLPEPGDAEDGEEEEEN